MEPKISRRGVVATTPAGLAKKVGVISNKIEAEQERHAVALAKLVEQLDHVYAQLGAEMAK